MGSNGSSMYKLLTLFSLTNFGGHWPSVLILDQLLAENVNTSLRIVFWIFCTVLIVKNTTSPSTWFDNRWYIQSCDCTILSCDRIPGYKIIKSLPEVASTCRWLFLPWWESSRRLPYTSYWSESPKHPGRFWE